MARPKRDVFGRFWEEVKIGPRDECWPWTAGLDGTGYGKFRVDREHGHEKAHRFAYRAAVGPIPEGLSVLHSCDNPPCCNPRHLAPGTMADNVRDMDVKGRRRAVPRDGLPQTKLTSALIEEARAKRLGNARLAAIYGVSKSTMSYALRGGRPKQGSRA